MSLGRKDIAATALTTLAVLAFLAARESWSVALVGGSNRWGATAILLLGVATCAQGSATKGAATIVLATLGSAALVLGVLALLTGSATLLLLLVVDVVVLWAASTLRHAVQPPRLPHAA
jgi:hypothetical protein